MSEEEHTLRAAPGRRAVEEWALVLAAAGIAHRVAGSAGGWRLLVAAGDADRSIAALDAYDAERRQAAAGEQAPEYGSTYGGLLVAALLVGSHRGRRPAARGVVARRRQPGAAGDARLGPRSGHRGPSLRPPGRWRARRGGGAAGRATARGARAVGVRRGRAGGRRRRVAGGAARLVKRA